jgi:hypothetical protein
VTSSEKPEKTLKEKVADWLESEGFPLEFYTASVFYKNGFDVNQGFYVRDIKSELPREIDVLADATVDVKPSFIRVSYVVECKWSRDKPWIIFTSKNEHLHPASCVAHTIGSSTGEAILWTLAGDEKLHSLDTFCAPRRPGFSGRQVFNKGNDIFYTAIQSVTSAAMSLVNWYNGNERTLSKTLELAVIALPVIVIDGPLFEAYFDSESGQMAIEEVEQVKVHWRGLGDSINTVDMVAANKLNDFVEKRRGEMSDIFERASTCLEQIHECYKKRSLTPLKVTKGPRGFIGLPPLLAAIHQLEKDAKRH